MLVAGCCIGEGGGVWAGRRTGFRAAGGRSLRFAAPIFLLFFKSHPRRGGKDEDGYNELINLLITFYMNEYVSYNAVSIHFLKDQARADIKKKNSHMLESFLFFCINLLDQEALETRHHGSIPSSSVNHAWGLV